MSSVAGAQHFDITVLGATHIEVSGDPVAESEDDASRILPGKAAIERNAFFDDGTNLVYRAF
ncbi:MAG: hypothetical protein WCG80_00150 [Spirochaetales bacterium]